MTRIRLLLSCVSMSASAVLVAIPTGCSPAFIGQETGADGGAGADGGPGADSGSDVDGGEMTCGTTTCTSDEICCPGSDIYCTLTCVSGLTMCPTFGRTCEVPPDSGTESDGSISDGPATGLHWYLTCGDPVCPAPSFDASVPTDGAAQDAATCLGIGASCSTMGQTCGGPTSCGSVETCLDHDPQAGACPISSRKFKDDIEYLDPAQLERMHDEVLRVRLATYNYKGQYADPNPKHLGFIVEDNPQGLAVDRGHDRVDLYGYLSMVVAAMQVQEKEIAALKQELAETRKGGCSASAK